MKKSMLAAILAFTGFGKSEKRHVDPQLNRGGKSKGGGKGKGKGLIQRRSRYAPPTAENNHGNWSAENRAHWRGPSYGSVRCRAKKWRSPGYERYGV